MSVRAHIGDPSAPFVARLEASGFAHAVAAEWRSILTSSRLADWASFAASWQRLDPDRWMADGGAYRRRRFATFTVRGGTVARKPHQAHFQSSRYNHLNGGVDRWFSPVETAIGDHPVTQALLTVGTAMANLLTGDQHSGWHAEMHQFRVAARAGEHAFPTPEGLHRDGVAAVLMMLVGRDNVAGGVTSITDVRGRPLARITLTNPLDAIMLDDRRLRHAVSAIAPAMAGRPATRDALVITFRANAT